MKSEWQITCWYLAVFTSIVVLAKIISIRSVAGRTEDRNTFIWSPSLCLSSWQKRGGLTRGGLRRVLYHGLLSLPTVVMAYLYYVPLYQNLPWWQQSYLAVLPFWLLVEAMQSLSQLLWLPSARIVPAVNDRPWLARTVAEFWGRRWNRLFGDWFRETVFIPLKRSPHKAALLSFLLSGILHELLVSLPYQIVYNEKVWGWLTGYFVIQYLAIIVERRFLRSCPVLNRLVVWCSVVGPIPLVLNHSTLLIFHLGG